MAWDCSPEWPGLGFGCRSLEVGRDIGGKIGGFFPCCLLNREVDRVS
jgi:hypothetical protein